MDQKAYKSWALWLAIAALVVFVAKQFFAADISNAVNGLLNVLLPVLVAFGIVNNPTNVIGIGANKPAADPAAPRAPDQEQKQ